jgi:hypothetical protein
MGWRHNSNDKECISLSLNPTTVKNKEDGGVSGSSGRVAAYQV